MLRKLPPQADPNVLVGFDTSDDAGVYRLTAECALVQTVDFFTPIVDDPYTYGAIAAANSLSDVYAMGGKPLTALSIVAYPGGGDPDVLAQILLGGLSKMREAGCTVVGGHSVSDPEVKFGYSVTGVVHPERIWANAGAKAGDSLVLTKPIGTGIIATAGKRGTASAEYLAIATENMLQLNRSAAEGLQSQRVNGCTDITGFGLLGHAREMALGSGVTLRIEANRVPLLPGVREYAQAGAIPGGLRNNRDFASCDVEVLATLPEDLLAILYDPQTSGGLLVSMPSPPPDATVIGSVVARQNKAIQIL